jgi:hypothetical protein
MQSGVDCATKVTKTVADKLAANGQKFVARYVVSEKHEWKRLSPEEAKTISDAGMDILSVFESSANRSLSGFEGGRADAQTCLGEIKRLSQPKGSAMYFAVDFDVTKPEQLDAIEQYLRGAAYVLGSSYPVGVYAEYSVIEEMGKRKAAKHFWQTYAWSNGKVSKLNNLYQYKNGQTLAGITVDFNNSYGNEGFWNLRPAMPTKPLTDFKDVPAGHWAEGAIANAVSKGLFVGRSDGTFGMGVPVTREELAVVVDRVLKGVDKNG